MSRGIVTIVIAVLVLTACEPIDQESEQTPENSPLATLTPTPTPTLDELLPFITPVTYDYLADNTQSVRRMLTGFRGKVAEVEVSSPSTEFIGEYWQFARIYTSLKKSGGDDDLFLDLRGPLLKEGDFVEFIGKPSGEWSYTTVLGVYRILPYIYSEHVRVRDEAQGGSLVVSTPTPLKPIPTPSATPTMRSSPAPPPK